MTKSMGRPRRHTDDVLSRSLTFRLRPKMDQALRQAAETEGRSISEEIEHRLIQSFEEPSLTENRVRQIVLEEMVIQRLGEERASFEALKEMKKHPPDLSKWIPA